MTLSKTTGTYQSTPGLFDIQLDDVIIGASSGVVARITSTSAYQDPVTQEFIPQVNISSGSSFFGLLFNRLTSVTYPNKVIDDISKSQVSIVDFTDNATAFDSTIPFETNLSVTILSFTISKLATLIIMNLLEIIQFLMELITSEFAANEDIKVRKLTFTDRQGSGFLNNGHVIRTLDTKAEVIGYSQATQTIYLGKIGRCKSTGEDYHSVTFTNATINTYNEKYGSTVA